MAVHMKTVPITEIATFRCKAGVTDTQLQAAFDACTRFLQRSSGFINRQLARDATSGLWVELCEWTDLVSAKAAAEAFWHDADTLSYRDCIDGAAPETNIHHVETFARAGQPKLAPFYPNLVTAKFEATWHFYTEQLGFSTAAEFDCYVHLIHPAGAQLGILRHELDGQPSELISAIQGRGMWLSLDVDNADAEYERLAGAGVPIVLPPEDKPWGERHFAVRDPNGVLIYLAHKLARKPELVTA